MDIFSGDDGLTYEVMKAGGKGVISVASNLYPAKIKELTDLIEVSGEESLEEARCLNESLRDLFEILFIETNPQPVKTAMALEGIISGVNFRLPMTKMLPENVKKLKSVLKKYK